MKTRFTVAAVAATGLLLAGGGTALALGSGDPEVAVAPAAVSTTTPPPAGPAVDGATAERIALERVGGGEVVSVEFDRDDDHDDYDDRDDRDDRDHWEVEIRHGDTEHDVDVDAATGEVLDDDVDHDD